MSAKIRARDIEVVAPNLKFRVSGVTTTISQLVPVQSEQFGIAVMGPGLPSGLPRLRAWMIPALLFKPKGRPFRIWHARRNIDLLIGCILKYLLRAPIRLVFTSASQRHHSRYTRLLISRMDAVVATSKRTGGYLQVPYHVVSHGVDCSRFSPGPEFQQDASHLQNGSTFLIGYVGRIRPQKGTDLFVRAAIEVLNRHPHCEAVLLGRATFRNRQFLASLEQEIHRHGLEDRIRFLGEQAPETWYRRFNLYVCPSLPPEGFGLTVLEAMACATAVVASDAGAYPETIVDGATGAVVRQGDVSALADAIEAYVAQPDLTVVHGRNGRKHVEANLSVQAEAQGLARVYDSLWHQDNP